MTLTVALGIALVAVGALAAWACWSASSAHYAAADLAREMSRTWKGIEDAQRELRHGESRAERAASYHLRGAEEAIRQSRRRRGVAT